MWSLLPGDRAFGPQLEGQFDFTLLFEQVMMTIVPGGVIALSLPYYLRTAIKAEQKVRSGFLLWAKLVVGVALLAIHTAALGVWYKASLFQTETGFAAAGMSLVASVCTLFILYISHTYSLQPSAFLSIFLTLTALFDITITRSYFRREGLTVFGALQAAVVILKLILVALEEVPKRNLFTQESVRSSASVETVSGFWNRVFFAWLNPLLLSGSRGELHMEDLPAVEQDFDCAKLYDRFLPLWNKSMPFKPMRCQYCTDQYSRQIFKIWPSQGFGSDRALAGSESNTPSSDVCRAQPFAAFPALSCCGRRQRRRRW